MRAALFVALAWLALGPQLRADQTIAGLEFLGMTTIPPGGEFDETVIGGLSGITYDSKLDRYYTISDDPSHRSPSRFYTLRIDLADDRLGPEGVEVEDVTILTDRRGHPFGEWVIDGEGITLTPRRTLLISSEGNVGHGVPPSIREVGLDGRELREYRIPKKWLAKKRKPHGVRHNSAFESLTVLPTDQTFFTATENALIQDGTETDLGQGSPARISRFRSKSGKLEADFVYLVDPVVAPPESEDGFRTNGLVELIALDESSLLALERSFTVGVGNSIRLFLVSTAGADNVRRFDSLQKRGDFTPVSKQLLIDLDELGLAPDNVEGMAFGPRLRDGRRSLVLISDDNFSSAQTTQILAFAVIDADSRIPAIQGDDHRSPLEEEWLADVRGVVTAVDLEGRRRRFWIQNLEEDANEATSEGLLISPVGVDVSVAVGDLVSIGGRIIETEFPGTLPVTHIEPNRVAVLAPGTSLPDPVTVGGGGRPVPPGVDDDGLEAFDASEDAIDFYESLEGMRVRIERATVVGPTSPFGTVTLAIDGGDGNHTSRGGLLLGADDPNTERLVVDGALVGGLPDIEVGQRLAAPLIGILDYAFGNYRLIATEPLRVADPESSSRNETVAVADDRLTVATYNVWNLDLGDSEERFSSLGDQIAAWGPDIMALQEIQDDSGTEDDGTVSATGTLNRLIEAVRAHGGPAYQALQIDPEDNADGGAPGGNIRVAFLYDPDRVSLPLTASSLGKVNPGRLFESSPAFRADPETGYDATRKPLAAEFEFHGKRILAINVHLKSKRGDDRIFGSQQPPVRRTETQRLAQVRELGGYVAARLDTEPDALVMILGDFNELEFRQPMRLFEEYGLANLIERTDTAKRYTYIFEGNSQAIDHILVSPALAERAAGIEILHLNADRPHSRRSSDHDAVLVKFDLGSSVE